MKISAAGTRGDEAKDFVDIYYLLRYMTMGKMFDNFKRKYKTNDIQHYIKSVVYFDEVPEKSWSDVKMIVEKLSVNKLKETLTRAVEEYNRSSLEEI